MNVRIVCPNGRPLPFTGDSSAPLVEFTRWRDLLLLPFWPTLIFGLGFAQGSVLVGDVDLSAILEGGGVSSSFIAAWLAFWALVAWVPSLRRGRQRRNIEAHYGDLNRYYTSILGDGGGRPGDMVYSCARFNSPDQSLRDAQVRKLELIFAKLGLRAVRPGETKWLLEIGSGWGDLAVLAAQRFGVHVLAITLSQAQLDRSRKLAIDCEVDHLVTFELMNYQDLPKLVDRRFDYVVSVGMYEHVGRWRQRRYFNVVREMLAPGGVSVLHCIVRQVPGMVDLLVRKVIFPGGHLAAGYQIDRLLARTGLFRTQAEFFWEDYALTLEHWLRAHIACRRAVEEELGAEFYRLRLLWLMGCIGQFRNGGPPGSKKTGLMVGQWTFTEGKPPYGSWPLGVRP